MQAVTVAGGRVTVLPPDAVARVLADGQYDGPGFLWVDGTAEDPLVQRLLTDVVRLRPAAVRYCTTRNFIPKAYAYADHVLLVLHAPELASGGHVHHLELDLVLATRLLVSVHGPVNPRVEPTLTSREVEAVRTRLDRGRYQPEHPYELAHGIITELLRRQATLVEQLASVVGGLELRATQEAQEIKEPVGYLTELFAVRQALLSLRTMAKVTSQTLAGAAGAAVHAPAEAVRLVDGLCEEATRIALMAEGETESIQGVTELYQSTTSTKMAVASERLAVVAAFTLPITAVASVYGMNLIVNQSTQVAHLVVVLVVMTALAGGILWWARRHDWL